MDRRTAIVERLARLALPPSERDEILDDLHEEKLVSDESRSRHWVAQQSLRIAARYHLESYREPDDQWRILVVFLLAAALLFIVPAATAKLFPGTVDVFTNPAMLALVSMWRSSHVASAVAAGLLVGRISVLPEHASAARWHVVMILVAWFLASHGIAEGSVAVLFLVAAAWLGERNRRILISGDTTQAVS